MQRPASTTSRPFHALGVVGAALLVGVAVAALTWWRLGPATRGTVWAEDGGVFLRERLALGPVDSLLHPYAGYLHLVPRVLVDVAWSLPVEEYARALSVGACLVVGAVAATVFVLSRGVVPQWPLRMLLAAVPALLPLAPFEIAGNAANLHWFLLFAVPWLLAYRARTWWGLRRRRRPDRPRRPLRAAGGAVPPAPREPRGGRRVIRPEAGRGPAPSRSRWSP